MTKEGETPITIALHELPNTVQIEIAMSPELQGRPSYRVYRYHDGQAEPIPLGPVLDSTQQKESFELSGDGTRIIIHTRRLSTYAVVGSEKVLGGSGTVEDGSTGMDVQAQVMEGGDGPFYKIDIQWGPMRFTYSTGRKWNSDEHRYSDVRIYDWIPGICYTGGNNRITVYNYSNADISFGFTVFPKLKEGVDVGLMNGVDMVVSQTNAADGLPASNVILQRVPREGADAPYFNSYLRLNGSPTDPEFYKGLATDEQGFVQVGDIAVTIAHLDGPRTPKSNS